MGRISYYYDPDVGNFYYAQGHPMKPHRMRMTHNLLVAYGLTDKMDVFMPPRAAEKDMTRFHADDYIQFLKMVTPDSVGDHHAQLSRFNVVEDCPVFDGLWEYCQIAAGGSLAGAARLNSGESDIAINWAGGLHHAKKAESSGFCYINDCVLAILELLKVHARVLYIDIDIHHGDGVEEAFYSTDRVMTASFHKYGGFFPGTGAISDTGVGRGKSYAVNFPLKDGIDDESYREIFVPVMSKVMEWYQPGAVVLQCGADSLTGDRLGCFNLTLRGHAQCVDFFKAYGVPLLLLGGGGYTVRNVARCWAYETSRVVGADLSDGLPFNDNLEFYAPEFRLHIVPSNMENLNTRRELEANKVEILEHLRSLPFAPSVPVMDTPRASPLGVHARDVDSDGEDPDVRHRTQRAKMVVDYEDSDDELITGGDDLRGNLPIARRRLKPGRTGAIFAARRSRSPSKALPSTARDTHSPPRLVPTPMPAPLPFPAHAPSGARKHPSILYPSADRDFTTPAESAARGGVRNAAKDGARPADGSRVVAVSPRASAAPGFKRKQKRPETHGAASGAHAIGRSSDGPILENAPAKGTEGPVEKHAEKASIDPQLAAPNGMGNDAAENEVFRPKWKKSEPESSSRIGAKPASTDGRDDDNTRAVALSSVYAMDLGEAKSAPKNGEKVADKGMSLDAKVLPSRSDIVDRKTVRGESSVVEKEADFVPWSFAARKSSLQSPRHPPATSLTEGIALKDVSEKPAEAFRGLKGDSPQVPVGGDGDAVMEDVEDVPKAEVPAVGDMTKSDKMVDKKHPEKLSTVPMEAENEQKVDKSGRGNNEKAALSRSSKGVEALVVQMAGDIGIDNIGTHAREELCRWAERPRAYMGEQEYCEVEIASPTSFECSDCPPVRDDAKCTKTYVVRLRKNKWDRVRRVRHTRLRRDQETREKDKKKSADSKAVSKSSSVSKGQSSEGSEKLRQESGNADVQRENVAIGDDRPRTSVDGKDGSNSGAKKPDSPSAKKPISPSATEQTSPRPCSPKNAADAPKLSKQRPDDEDKDGKMLSDASGSVGQAVQSKVRDSKASHAKPGDKSAGEEKSDSIKGKESKIEAKASDPALSKATESSAAIPQPKENMSVLDSGSKKGSASDAAGASTGGLECDNGDKAMLPPAAVNSTSAKEEKAKGEKPREPKADDEKREARKEGKPKAAAGKEEAATEPTKVDVEPTDKASTSGKDSTMPRPRPPFPTLGLSRFPLPGMPPPPPKSPSAGLIPQASPPPVSPAPARKRWAPAGISAPPTRRPSGSPIQSTTPTGSAGPSARRPSGSPGQGGAPAFRSEPAPSLTPSAAATDPKSSTSSDKNEGERGASKSAAKAAEPASASDGVEKKSARDEKPGGGGAAADSSDGAKKPSTTEAKPLSGAKERDVGKSGKIASGNSPPKLAADERAKKGEEPSPKGPAPTTAPPKPAPAAPAAPADGIVDNPPAR